MPFESAFESRGRASQRTNLPGMLDPLLYLGPAGAVLALTTAWGLHSRLAATENAEAQVFQEIGATARQLSTWTLGLTGGIFVALLMLYFAGLGPSTMGPAVLAGGLCSAGASYLSTLLACRASQRAQAAARQEKFDQVAGEVWKSGAVIGLTSSAVAVLFVSLCCVVLLGLLRPLSLQQAGATMIGFSLGYSLQALLSHLSGGLVARATRLSSRADPPGGEIAASAADLCDSYVITLFAASCLAAAAAAELAPTDNAAQIKAASLPVALAGVGMLASLVGLLVGARVSSGSGPTSPLEPFGRAPKVSLGLFALGSAPLCYLLIGGLLWPAPLGWLGPWLCLVLGQLLALACRRAKVATSPCEFNPAESNDLLQQASEKRFEGWPLLLGLGCCVLLTYRLGGGFSAASLGGFAIALAGLGLLSTLGLSIASATIAPLLYDAIGQRKGEQAQALRQLAGTHWGASQTFTVLASSLSALSLLAAYGHQLKAQLIEATSGGEDVLVWAEHELDQVGAREVAVTELISWYEASAISPLVLFGLFSGACAALLVSAATARETAREALARAAKSRPEVDALAASGSRAGRRLVLPLTCLLSAPLAVTLSLGPPASLGFSLGTLAAGLPLAALLSGASWFQAGLSRPASASSNAPLKEAALSLLGVAMKLPAVGALVFAGLAVRFAPAIAQALGLF